MIVLNHPQGSEDWLRARIGACTASRFSDARERVGGLTEQQAKYVNAILAGSSEPQARILAGYKNKPSSEVVERALAGMPVGEPGSKAINYAWLIAMETVSREPRDDTFVTKEMRRGQDLEPIARAVYEKRTGAWIEEASLILTDDERFGYSTDGFRDDDGLIEIKCPSACHKLGQVWEEPEAAHLEYLDQINGGLWITGRNYCDLVIYCPWLKAVGKDLFVKRIFRNEQAIQELEDDLMSFWKFVERNLETLRTPAKMSGALRDSQPAPEVDSAPVSPVIAALSNIPESIF